MASALSCRCQPTVSPCTGIRLRLVLLFSRWRSPTAAETPPRASAKSRSSRPVLGQPHPGRAPGGALHQGLQQPPGRAHPVRGDVRPGQQHLDVLRLRLGRGDHRRRGHPAEDRPQLAQQPRAGRPRPAGRTPAGPRRAGARPPRGEAPNMPRTSSRPMAYNRSSPMRHGSAFRPRDLRGVVAAAHLSWADEPASSPADRLRRARRPGADRGPSLRSGTRCVRVAYAAGNERDLPAPWPSAGRCAALSPSWGPWVWSSAFPLAASADDTVAFTISDSRITESSGLATDPGADGYWTVNDSGDSGIAYGLSTSGKVTGHAGVPGAARSTSRRSPCTRAGCTSPTSATTPPTATRHRLLLRRRRRPTTRPSAYRAWDFTYPDGAARRRDPAGRRRRAGCSSSPRAPRAAVYARRPQSRSRDRRQPARRVGDAPARGDRRHLPARRGQIALLTYGSSRSSTPRRTRRRPAPTSPRRRSRSRSP